MMESIRKTIRLGLVLLSGATLATAGSLTQPCKKVSPKENIPVAKADRLEAYCEASSGLSDAGLKGGDTATTTWHRSGSMFTPRYSAVLTPSATTGEKPEVEAKPLPWALPAGMALGN